MEVQIINEMEFDDPYLVEGFPGVGLVAKIASDYIVEKLDMDLYAQFHSEQTPSMAVFEDDYELRAAVRIYGSEEHNLLVLKSDAPVSSGAGKFLANLNQWMDENSITPIYQLGIPAQTADEEKKLFGASTGGKGPELEKLDINKPPGFGIITGPTGGLLKKAIRHEIPALGLAVTSDPKFPDPLAAKKLIDEGVKPVTGLDIETQQLEESSEMIKKQKERIAQQVQEAEDHETSQAYPTEMYT